MLARRKRTKSTKPMTIKADDIIFAELYVLRIIQQYEFNDDY